MSIPAGGRDEWCYCSFVFWSKEAGKVYEARIQFTGRVVRSELDSLIFRRVSDLELVLNTESPLKYTTVLHT